MTEDKPVSALVGLQQQVDRLLLATKALKVEVLEAQVAQARARIAQARARIAQTRARIAQLQAEERADAAEWRITEG